ncbi:MAG: hypothetical protein ACRDYA_01480 [Egibacteraceae bacterium]
MTAGSGWGRNVHEVAAPKLPPPSVNPPTPVVDTRPLVVARPYGWMARSGWLIVHIAAAGIEGRRSVYDGATPVCGALGDGPGRALTACGQQLAATTELSDRRRAAVANADTPLPSPRPS